MRDYDCTCVYVCEGGKAKLLCVCVCACVSWSNFKEETYLKTAYVPKEEYHHQHGTDFVVYYAFVLSGETRVELIIIFITTPASIHLDYYNVVVVRFDLTWLSIVRGSVRMSSSGCCCCCQWWRSIHVDHTCRRLVGMGCEKNYIILIFHKFVCTSFIQRYKM